MIQWSQTNHPRKRKQSQLSNHIPFNISRANNARVNKSEGLEKVDEHLLAEDMKFENEVEGDPLDQIESRSSEVSSRRSSVAFDLNQSFHEKGFLGGIFDRKSK